MKRLTLLKSAIINVKYSLVLILEKKKSYVTLFNNKAIRNVSMHVLSVNSVISVITTVERTNDCVRSFINV